jgi:all-trans-retinol 13,14-reductase
MKALGKEGLRFLKSNCNEFLGWRKKKYIDLLQSYFPNNQSIQNILCAFLNYTGAIPSTTTADVGLVNAIGYFLYGGSFPKGGAITFAQMLKRSYVDSGGMLLLKTKANKMNVKDGNVVSLETSVGPLYAKNFLSDINVKNVILDILELPLSSNIYRESISKLTLSSSAFMVHLGLPVSLDHYPSIIKTLDTELDIVINSNVDKCMAPVNHSSVSILKVVNYKDFNQFEHASYENTKQNYAEKIITDACQLIPELGMVDPVCKIISTPQTYERYLLCPQGAIFAIEQSVENKPVYFQTPINNLRLSGASVFPGAGIEASAISGLIAANDILDWAQRFAISTTCK